MKKTIFSVLKYAFRYIAEIVICMFLGCFLLCAANLLPNGQLREKAGESVQDFLPDEIGTPILGNYKSTIPDKYTDSIMLNISIYEGKEPFLRRVLGGYSANYGLHPYENFAQYVANARGYIGQEYARYWHGYTVVLKPLLMLFNYDDILYINTLVQLLVVCLIVYLFAKRNDGKYLLSFLSMLLLLNPMTVSMSLQYMDVFYITMCAIAIILINPAWLEKFGPQNFFFLIGVLICFFDFLTYPILSLGVPLILWILLKRTNAGVIQNMLFQIKCSFFWVFGYIGMWFGKWVIWSIYSSTDGILDGIQRVIFRTGNQESGVIFTNASVQKENLNMIFIKPYGVIFCILIIIMLFNFMHINKNHKLMQKSERGAYIEMNVIIPVAVISLYPFIWYAGVKDHSYIHAAMTYRDMGVTAFGVFSIASVIGTKFIADRKVDNCKLN